MGKWARRILIGLGVLVVVAAGAYYWLLIEDHVPGGGSFTIDIAELRRLANTVPGEKASAVRVEQIAGLSFPGAVIVSGDSWDTKAMPVFSYQVVLPGGTVIVDTALDAKTAEGMNSATYDAQAYDRMRKAMAEASVIVVTHEHLDHIGGLITDPDFSQLLKAAKLTKEQITNPKLMGPVAFPEGSLAAYQPLTYEGYAAVAPGVVLIKAPGHTPGSQMVFVQTASGAEFLFLGDVAWHWRNVELVRERPRLVTMAFLGEDRDAVHWQLQELHRLSKAEPALHIVPGHDPKPVADLVAAGALTPKFQ